MKTGTPSATARLVALNVLVVGMSPNTASLVAPSAVAITTQLLRSAGWFARLIAHLLAWSCFRWLFLKAERLTIPGLALHHALRKRAIEDRVRQALDAGLRQVVVLGGGLDTLAMRLSREFAAVRFWELDHPATQAVKRRVASWAGNLRLLPADFVTERPEAVLARDPEFRAHEPALYVCEGVLMYLSEAEVTRLLTALPRAGEGASQLIFTCFVRDADGRAGFAETGGLVGAWLRRQGEPFRWATDAVSLAPFLSACGFRLEVTIGAEDLRRELLTHSRLAAMRPARGEWIAVASQKRVGG